MIFLWENTFISCCKKTIIMLIFIGIGCEMEISGGNQWSCLEVKIS